MSEDNLTQWFNARDHKPTRIGWYNWRHDMGADRDFYDRAFWDGKHFQGHYGYLGRFFWQGSTVRIANMEVDRDETGFDDWG